MTDYYCTLQVYIVIIIIIGVIIIPVRIPLVVQNYTISIVWQLTPL